MIRFALPLLFCNVLQMLYTVADSAVLGRLIGVNAFASVGATASLYWLVLSAVLGITQGFGTIFAQRFGANDTDGLRRSFVTASYMTAAVGLLISAIGVPGCVYLLRLLNTPPELLDGAATYLRWFLGGIIVTLAYNLMGAMLRALGDGKTPLRAVIMSTFLNIALSVALAIPFGIAGVAAATILTQTAAFAFCFRVLRKGGILKGCGFRWDAESAKPLLRLGLPLGLRNAVIETGGLVVQRYINGFDVEFVAGIAAAKRMYSLIMIAGGAIEASVATFVAQNFGAKRYDRISRGMRDGLMMMLVSAASVMAVVLPFGRFILSLLIEGDPGQVAAVLDVGARQLTLMTLGLPLVYLLFLYRSALQGLGNTFIPMLSGIAELMMRIMSVILLTPVWGEWGVYFSDPIGWPVAAALLLISYHIVLRKIKRRSHPAEASA
jgi:putative MATE family efflux protein